MRGMPTPNIDRLASEGMQMTQFLVEPGCTPSRAALMTGRYPRHHGVRWNGSALPENEVTLTEHLGAAGYEVARVGKHHINQKRFRDTLDVEDA